MINVRFSILLTIGILQCCTFPCNDFAVHLRGLVVSIDELNQADFVRGSADIGTEVYIDTASGTVIWISENSNADQSSELELPLEEFSRERVISVLEMMNADYYIPIESV